MITGRRSDFPWKELQFCGSHDDSLCVRVYVRVYVRVLYACERVCMTLVNHPLVPFIPLTSATYLWSLYIICMCMWKGLLSNVLILSAVLFSFPCSLLFIFHCCTQYLDQSRCKKLRHTIPRHHFILCSAKLSMSMFKFASCWYDMFDSCSYFNDSMPML